MKSSSNIEIRRCRPYLGTFVEIGAEGADPAAVERGIDAAFAAVARVHRLMSFHDPRSDVSRINREAFPKAVTVDPWTWQVLKTAQELARESSGAFDIAVGIAPNRLELFAGTRLSFRSYRHLARHFSPEK